MYATARQTSQELGKLDGLSEAEASQIARMVSMGCLKYFILKVDPKKNMLFNPKESIDFNGNTGAFIQYTYARICSLLRKAEEQNLKMEGKLSSDLVISDKETALIQLVAEFASVVKQAGEEYSPALIANYAYELVKEYNQFYHDFSVLKEEDPAIRLFRLRLSATVARTARVAMSLLGIEMPERM
jgi:arginyl-tRNA synthetase